MDLYRRDYKIDGSLLPLLVPAPPLNQGPFPPPALPGYLGNTGLSAIPLALSFPRGPPVGPAFADPPHGTSRVATGLLPQTCRHQNPGELAQCSLRPLPAQWQPSVLKPGQRSHYMILGLAQCSFALLPVRSLTPFKGAFFTEGSGRLVASSSAPIATGWSEICRVGPYLSHRSPAPFSRRTWIGMHPTHENLVAECQQCGADKHAEDALGCHATQCADQYHRHRRLDTASQK
jgi:hypothetical protein